jgi:quercetin dioxygenase-like cupin family protein
MNRFNQVAALLKAGVPVPGAIHHEDAWSIQVGNIYAKQMLLPKGSGTVGHSHEHDHMTLLAKGRLVVIVGDTETEYVAPAAILVKAKEHHALVALEETVAYCIHDVSQIDADDLGVPY